MEIWGKKMFWCFADFYWLTLSCEKSIKPRSRKCERTCKMRCSHHQVHSEFSRDVSVSLLRLSLTVNCTFSANILPFVSYPSFDFERSCISQWTKPCNFATVYTISTQESISSLYSFHESNVTVFGLVYRRSFSHYWVILADHSLLQHCLHSGDETKLWFEVDEWSNLKGVQLL